MPPRLSVALVTYNGAKHVREQLSTILAQDPPPAEVIIGDDGSTDGTLGILREMAAGARVPVRILDGDHVGLRLNMQRTLAACAGDIVVLADQDDIWLPGRNAAVLAGFAREDVAVWFSDARLVDDSGNDLGRTLWQEVTIGESERRAIEDGDALRRLLHGSTVTGATMAFRRSLLDVALPLPEELELGRHLYLHDGWIAVLGSLLGRMVADPHVWTLYRQHDGQVRVELMEGQVGRTPGALTSAVAIEAEHDRVALVLARLHDKGVIDQCHPEAITILSDLGRLLNTRTLPGGVRKWSPVLRELLRGNYGRYARGWRTAAADLVGRRGRAA